MKPIIFNTEMARAILGGRKTQTRRPVKRTDTGRVKAIGSSRNWHLDDPKAVTASPYQVGDVLYVREAFTPIPLESRTLERKSSRWNIIYKAGGSSEVVAPPEYNPMLYSYERWTPSIHMPKWAARIFLKVTAVRLERLQDISEADAIAEGVKVFSTTNYPVVYENYGTGLPAWFFSPRSSFLTLYQSIYGNWADNPWVWVIEFERIDKPE